MLHKTRAIALKNTRYSETSVVSRIYTERFGMQSYIINSVRSAKAKTKMSLLQPLSLLEMVVYHGETKNLQRVSEIKAAHVFKSIPFDVYKSSIAVFLAEILHRAIREQEANDRLFDFIFRSIHYLDERKESFANFHLSFLLQFSGFLGFAPGGEYSNDARVFDLQEGRFVRKEPPHLSFLKEPLSRYFYDFMHGEFGDAEKIPLNRSQRKAILEKILFYYSLHLDNFRNIVSPKVLEEVFE